MTIEERLEAITQTLELVAQMQLDHEKRSEERLNKLDDRLDKMGERLDTVTERLDTVTERLGQAMDAINGLARIAELHQHRLDNHEDRLDKLES